MGICTKWVEAVALSMAIGQVVANFIKENIIYRFGIPRVILSDNRTLFVNGRVRALFQQYHVTHYRSTPCYPKGNRQAEATNKTLLRILRRTLKEQHGKWAEQLPLAFWAYRTIVRGATSAMPFSLVYNTEMVVSIEIAVPSGGLVKRSQPHYDLRLGELEGLQEQREHAKGKLKIHQHRVARAYNVTA
ncbi:uncharacterized protein LOC132277555 [Cornus florida]|uniref:uncharacterized protein LOC132277555 n=1 Tax=Cornus florida TaxID=4283 RepID=UPI00289CBB86|nr:uncharacterized protein LOC132277555 [Cornus florida]